MAHFILILQVMVKRQRTAFPPNFVHSLDGSHMMMTAVACKKLGLNFAGAYLFINNSHTFTFPVTYVVCVFFLSIFRNSNFVNLCLIAGVHDSYWTHAGDVDEMNRILREKFVELYDAPILENVK